MQLEGNRHFLAENPVSSDMWKLPEWITLQQHPQTCATTLHQCMYGLTDPDGKPTMKPTRLLASHPVLLEDLCTSCDNSHQHETLQGSTRGILRTRYAQTWPRRLVELMVRNIKRLLDTHHELHFFVRSDSTHSLPCFVHPMSGM